jgi:hypothetical protein
MKTISTALLALLSLGGCVVHTHRHDHTPPPPPPPRPAPVVVHYYGWNHHRYVVWREYYGCTPDEVYWLENSGYDDDDVLVCLTIARRARVPVRHVFYEYDRCGRSLFTVSAVFRLPIGIFFCNEVPINYACPPPYGRAYGYYWRNQHHYYTNAEIHSLVQLQVGIRYYGYNHAVYFRDYDQCVQKYDRTPFRTIVVREPQRAGSGGRSCDEKPIVKCPKPWDKPDPKDWDRHREQERREVKVRYTPERERQEQEQARRDAERDERKRSFEEAKAKSEAMKREREDEDRRNPPPPVRRVGPAEPPQKVADPRGPEQPKKPEPLGPAEPPQKVADPRGPEQPKKPEPLGPGERRVGPAPEDPRKEDPRTQPPGRKPVEEAPKENPGRKPIEEQPKNTPPGRKPVEEAPKENPGRKPVEEQPKGPPPGRKPVEEAPKENPARKPAEEQPKAPPPGKKPVEQPKAPPPAEKSGGYSGKSDAPKGNDKGGEQSDDKGNNGNKKPK